MTILYQASYSLPANDQPLTHARIAHSRNWLDGGTATATVFVLFIPSGSNSLIDANGDTFRVQG